ncbi:Galactoside 2-alpha-L-fucosyltransferase [Melia azedarach]|uniref:Galactoside 2-alpha-L-fucosyltransferase n=1 Tax=Melia azedarach TaxID=155640 RepID=A0ACC1XL22_MELAZ|nr:Galactoside 2-alpha-L-fucosyltransferase [Melia azedarach]
MDLNSFRRRFSPLNRTDQPLTEVARAPLKSFGFSTMKINKVFAACLIIFPILLTISLILRHQPTDQILRFADARILDGRNISSVKKVDDLPKDKLLSGLLAPGFDEGSCLSRYQSVLFRKPSPYKPSRYLLSKLRNYEALHKRCGPHTKSYNETLKQLKSGHNIDSTDCKYIVWISFSGLGNRIISIASVFLYALLTDRVLLVDRGKDMDSLFCEPFPETSWLLPLDFPIIDQFNRFDRESSHCYGKLLNDSITNATTISLPSYLYIHIVHDYDHFDKLFFCDEYQALLGRVPWLIIRTDNYIVPSLFLIQAFGHELGKLFPEKGAIFHHLGRYLFHPTNPVWGLITRYYQAYLARADERIGIQVRVFDTRPGPFQYVIDQILGCAHRFKLLPEIDVHGSGVTLSAKPKVKSVLMTSLTAGYYENLRNIYWEYPTVTGDMISFYQPSHEEYQQTEQKLHEEKAFAEMYLLSLTDVLVTSPWSTFGYVAQGLGGLRPWILYKPENDTAPDPPCVQSMSIEPCFHAPPFYDCKAKKGIDTGTLVPHVRHCEDMSWGLKVVDSTLDFPFKWPS